MKKRTRQKLLVKEKRRKKNTSEKTVQGKNRHACEKNSMKEKQKTVVEKGGKHNRKKRWKHTKREKSVVEKNGRTSAKNSGKTVENAHKNAQKNACTFSHSGSFCKLIYPQCPTSKLPKYSRYPVYPRLSYVSVRSDCALLVKPNTLIMNITYPGSGFPIDWRLIISNQTLFSF